MKAILVIDMPTNCAECKLMSLYGIGESLCNPVDWDERPPWCLLKPMPQKCEQKIMQPDENWKAIETKLLTDYAQGWNDCLKEITE